MFFFHFSFGCIRMRWNAVLTLHTVHGPLHACNSNHNNNTITIQLNWMITHNIHFTTTYNVDFGQNDRIVCMPKAAAFTSTRRQFTHECGAIDVQQDMQTTLFAIIRLNQASPISFAPPVSWVKSSGPHWISSHTSNSNKQHRNYNDYYQ